MQKWWKKLSKRKRLRIIFSLIAAVPIALLIWNPFQRKGKIEAPEIVDYTPFLHKARDSEIKEIASVGTQIKSRLKNGKTIITFFDADVIKPPFEEFEKLGIKISFREPPPPTDWWWVGRMLACVLIGVVWGYLFFSGISPGGEISLKFWRPRRTRFLKLKDKTTFEDVGGIGEAKAEVGDVIEFLTNPAEFERLGSHVPKNILLIGPPGTGKTLLARAMAGEANVPFFEAAGSDFVEMYVGVGASRVRDLWDKGKEAGRCIIYIDEIDAVGRKRGGGFGGADREYEQATTALLTEIDGFDKFPEIILVASTNRPDILDDALTSRFERHVIVPPSDARGREEILRIHIRKQKKTVLASDVDLAFVSEITQGFSGRELRNLVNEAALFATKEKREEIIKRDFVSAKDKVLLGPEQKSQRAEEEIEVSEHHEAGHAIVAACLRAADRIEKVTTVARGATGGGLYSMPHENRIRTKEYLLATMALLMGGRVAERRFRGTLTAGAQNDIQRVNELARQMVCEWGMSSLGAIYHGPHTDLFYGKTANSETQLYSQERLQAIEKAAKDFVVESEATAEKILQEHESAYHKLVAMLHEQKMIDGKEIYALVEHGDIGAIASGNTEDNDAQH